MIKAVIYARYSSSSQTEQSIEGQIRVCREFAEREIPMFDEAYDILIKYKGLPMDERIYNFSSRTMDRIM